MTLRRLVRRHAHLLDHELSHVLNPRARAVPVPGERRMHGANPGRATLTATAHRARCDEAGELTEQAAVRGSRCGSNPPPELADEAESFGRVIQFVVPPRRDAREQR